MNVIAKTKWGDCSRCPSKNVACVKVAKDLVCIPCHRKAKGKEQIAKAQDREKLRRGGNPKTAAERLGRSLRLLAVTEPDVRAGKDYAELDRWFKDRQKEMTGKCQNCGGKTEKDSRHYKCSVAHLLPKAYFKSVATHPDNWLELCFYGQSCHTNFDNKMIDIIDLHCFDTVIQKFVKIYPFIAQEERRRIPPILLEYLKTEI